MQKDVRSAVPRASTRKKTIDESQEEDVRQKVVDLVIARTPEQVSQCRATGSGGLLSRSLCAQRFGTGMKKSNSTGEERTDVLCA